MDEYNPFASLIPDFKPNLLDADAAALPAIAGAAPGLIDEIGGFAAGTIANELNPLFDLLSGQTGAFFRDVWASAQSALSLVLRFALKRELDAFSWLLGPFWYNVYRQRFGSANFTAGDMFSTMMEALWQSIETAKGWGLEWLRQATVNAMGFLSSGWSTLFAAVAEWVKGSVTWLKDRTVEALGFAAWGYTHMTAGVGALVQSGTAWVKDRVVDALGYAAYGFGSLASFIAAQFSGLGTWIYDTIIGPITTELGKIPGYLVAGAQDIAGFFEEGLKRVFLGPIDELVSLAQFKLTIPGKLVRGEYTSVDAFIEDVTDPAPLLLAGAVLAFVTPLIIALTASGVMTTLVQPLLERPTQAARKRLGDHLMTLNDIQESWNRGFLTESMAVDLLGRIGYGGQSLEAVKKMRFRLPPLTDVMRMAVKEVFSESRGPLQLDADYPGDVLTKAGLGLGLEEVWTRNYWAAHWDLPSPTQGYEMLHRRKIGPGQLDDLLKALDYSPAWRGLLASISYNPLTRVDIRRMYAAGVLNESEVNLAYQDIGYDVTNAARLTEFTKRNYAPGDQVTGVVNRELTAAQIRTAYRRHVITRADAGTRLIEIGYDVEEANFQLALDDAQLAANPLTESGAPVRDASVAVIRQAYREGIYAHAEAVAELEALGFLGAEVDVMLALDDIQLARDLKNAEIALVRERYIGFSIDAGAARAELAAVGVGARQQALLLAEWAAEAERGTRRLSVAEVFRARAAGYFTDSGALAYLLRLGYNQADAQTLFDLRTAA